MKKYVYAFYEGDATMRNILGGKGANLAEMTKLGLPVPYGFTITTEACNHYYHSNKIITPEIQAEIRQAISELENISGKKFNDLHNPLLVSVRSGSRASMPGMMDTILNLGMNDTVVEVIAQKTNNERFAYDSYRRFIQMFADVVMGLSKSKFETIIDEIKEEKNVVSDQELDSEDFKEMVKRFKIFYKKNLHTSFPTDPHTQLLLAVEAVFKSWNNQRAIFYRKMNDIPHDWGTAVNVQMMVFGNMGEDCATGVAFSRNPSNGENHLFGEFLINAQGEDVVAGVRTPLPIEQLKALMPNAYHDFATIAKKLEHHYHDMQDMEFTIENNKLFMLQTRNGKRTATAALKIACDMVDEKLLTEKEALLSINPKHLDSLLHPQFNQEILKSATILTNGLAASPGAACGQIVFTAEDALKSHQNGKKVILVRLETSPEDIEGMAIAEGILTVRGGMTSHAAIVARGMGTCCVSGAGEIKINEANKTITINTTTLNEFDFISIDGSTGLVYAGEIPTIPATISKHFDRVMTWAKKYKKLSIRCNADTPQDAQLALQFGAEGIGLTRSEHMFFEADRIKAMREMIVAKTTTQRKNALAKLLPYQRSDFEQLFKIMENLPITIRYLDPPLHEFLPTSSYDIANIANEMKIDVGELKQIITSLHEFNPMMGHRGCRLAISYPEIAEMQTRAIIEAAININKQYNYHVTPEIMIPLIGDINEFKYLKNIIKETADNIIIANNVKLNYKIGTMIEIPRAALLADEIAQEAEFFSFGTNDLTQMTFGFSRDDAASFLTAYYDKKIYEHDPFVKIDQKGVGKLIQFATTLGKSTRPALKLGICGEHGGDPSTIEFCHHIGLDYVSCSPYRVPIAYIAAAQAAIKSHDH